MKKSEKENLKLGLLIVLLLSVFALTGKGLVNFSILGTQGFTTLSLQEASFLDTSELNTKAWLLTVIPGGSNQWVEGSIARADIDNSQIYDDGTEAQRDLKIDISNHKQRCEYPVQIDTLKTPIYSFGGEVMERNFWGFCETETLLESCSAKGDVLKYGDIESGDGGVLTGSKGYCGCIYGNKEISNIATIPGEADRIYESTISITNGDQVYSGTVSNIKTSSVDIGNIAKVRGIDLSSGLACPSTTQFLVTERGGQWNLISDSLYDTYRTNFDSRFITGEFIITSRVEFWKLVNDMNYLAESATTSQEWCDGSSGCAEYSGGAYFFIPDYTISNPIIQMTVRADWLGIIQPKSKPQITCDDSSLEIGSGGGTVKFTVKNIGNGRGTADVFVSCGYPVSQEGGTTSLFLNPDESRTSAIGIKTSPVNSNTDSTCTVTASMSDGTDSCTTKVRVNPSQVCEPLKKTCKSTGVQQCNDAGTAWVTIDDCIDNEICQFTKQGEPTCVTEEIYVVEENDYTTIFLALGALGIVYFLGTRKRK